MGLMVPISRSLGTKPERVKHYVERSAAANTLRAYRAHWAEFEAFCASSGYPSMPAPVEAVVEYLTLLADAGRRVSTLAVKCAAIGWMHDSGRQPNPIKSIQVRTVMKGIRRALGTAPRPVAPVTLSLLRTIIAALPNSLRGKRDRALILLGYAGAFRRSELVGLDVSDVLIEPGKITLRLSHSKTDQEGAGTWKVIPRLDDPALCPVAALLTWLDEACIRSGAVFRPIDRWGHIHSGTMDGQEVARIVKRAAAAAGLDARALAGHSLRRGFVTEAAEQGVSDSDIMEQTGHRSRATVDRYKEHAGLGARRAVRAVFGE